MTHPNSVYLLRRAYEKVVATLGALAVTALVLASVDTQAATPREDVTPSVSILVPTVTIEAVEE